MQNNNNIGQTCLACQNSHQIIEEIPPNFPYGIGNARSAVRKIGNRFRTPPARRMASAPVRSTATQLSISETNPCSPWSHVLGIGSNLAKQLILQKTYENVVKRHLQIFTEKLWKSYETDTSAFSVKIHNISANLKAGRLSKLQKYYVCLQKMPLCQFHNFFTTVL